MTITGPQDDQAHALEVRPEHEAVDRPDIAQPVEGFATQLSPRPRNNKGRIGFAVAGAAAAVGGALYALTGGGSGDNSYPTYPLPHAETPDAPGVIGTPTPNDSITPSTQPEVEPAPVIEPILMTADTAEGVLDQFQHNLTCFFNNPDFQAQQKCLSYIMGDDESALSALFNERLSRVVDYRASHPEFEVEQDFANSISRFYPNEVSPDSLVIVSELTDNTGEVSKVRYTFVKNRLTEQQYDVEDQPVEAWMLYREEGLEPGEPNFAQ